MPVVFPETEASKTRPITKRPMKLPPIVIDTASSSDEDEQDQSHLVVHPDGRISRRRYSCIEETVRVFVYLQVMQDKLLAAKEAARAAVERAKALTQLQQTIKPEPSNPEAKSSTEGMSDFVFPGRKRPRAFDFENPRIKREFPLKQESAEITRNFPQVSIKQENHHQQEEEPDTPRPSPKDKWYMLEVPDTEWWDEGLVADPQLVTDLVEHPVPFESSVPRKTVRQGKVYLTPQESSKLKKLRRREKIEDEQEKVRNGDLPKPQPRVNISSMMRILGNQSVADPSRMEAEVRMQMAERVQKHLEANESRKLSPEDRKQKNMQKWTAHSGEDIVTSCFIIEMKCMHAISKNESNSSYENHTEFSNQLRFKICKNAQQLQLSGCCLVPFSDSDNLSQTFLLVEGKPKSVKKFQHMLLNRINWKHQTAINNVNTNSATNKGDDDDVFVAADKRASADGVCERVWSGISATQSFDRFIWREIKNHEDARNFFSSRRNDEARKFLSIYQSKCTQEKS